MDAWRYGIYRLVFIFDISLVRCAHSFDIDVNTRRWIPYLRATMYYSVYYINLLMTAFLTIFRRFPTTFWRFLKIFQLLFWWPDKRFWIFSQNFRKFPKMSKDFRRVLKTFEEDPKMFRWYTNKFKYNSRDKLDINKIIDVFTCEAIVSFLSICYHSVYHWLLYNKCK